MNTLQMNKTQIIQLYMITSYSFEQMCTELHYETEEVLQAMSAHKMIEVLEQDLIECANTYDDSAA